MDELRPSVNTVDSGKPFIEAMPETEKAFHRKLHNADAKFIANAKKIWNFKMIGWVALTLFAIFLWVWVGVYHRNAVPNYLYRYRDESDPQCDAALGGPADADDDDSTDYCLEVDHLGNTWFLLPAAIGATITWLFWTITVLDRMWWSYSNVDGGHAYHGRTSSFGYRYIVSFLSTARQSFEIYRYDVDKLYYIVFLPLNWAVWYSLGQIAGIADLAVWILIGGYAFVYAIFGVTSQVVNRIRKYKDGGKRRTFEGVEWSYLAFQAAVYIFAIVLIWVVGYGYAVDNTHEKFYVHWGVIYASLYYLIIEIAWSAVHLKLRHKYPGGRIRSFYARWLMALFFHISYWVVLAVVLRTQRFTV